MACATFASALVRPWPEHACVGVPPEKEVYPEPRRDGALLAALGRVLRGAFDRSPSPAPAGLRHERGGP